jgi:hypothetical protein
MQRPCTWRDAASYPWKWGQWTFLAWCRCQICKQFYQFTCREHSASISGHLLKSLSRFFKKWHDNTSPLKI